MAHEKMTTEMTECIDPCTACHHICVECISHCLALGGAHANAPHIKALMDCEDLCQASATLMLRGSGLHADVCDTCADACAACAESCEAMPEDAMMRHCAEICRRCEASCRRMAAQ